MTKKKESQKSQKDKFEKKSVMTEWQKRNIEFLKKKEAEKAEKKKRQEKLRLERTHKKEEAAEEGKTDKKLTTEEKKKAREAKKEEAKKEKEAKKLQKLEAKKEKTPLQKAIHHALPVLITSGLVLLISIFLVTPFSKKKVVTVSGVSVASQDEVIKDSGIKASDYVFSMILHHSTYEKNIISKNKLIKSASLKYRFPNKFDIAVKEYNIVAYAQTDDGYQPILENGTRLNVVGASELPDSFLTINLSSEKDIKTLIKAFSKLDKDLVNQIQIISLADSSTTSDLLKLEMYDGNVVRVPLSEIAKKLPYYLKIKDGLPENSIVDMEVGIFATSESIEASVAEDKDKAKQEAENKDSSESESAEESQTESSEGDASTELSEAENAENQTVESETTEQTNNVVAGEQDVQQ